MAYQCSICSAAHSDLPHIGSDRPAHYWDVAEEERARRIELTGDTCVIDGEHFFVRGVIEIPVRGHRDGFGFGAWVSHKKENFEAYLAAPDSNCIGPFFGWLSTEISFYSQPTLLLKTMAHYVGGNQRPRIQLEPAEHPLALHQKHGIALDEAWQIVHHYMDREKA